MNPLVSELALYDIANTPGVAADVGHMNCRAKVTVRRGPLARESRPQATVPLAGPGGPGAGP